MTALPWSAAVAAGIVTEDESDLFRAFVIHLGPCQWRMNTEGLGADQVERLARVLHWFTTVGGVQ